MDRPHIAVVLRSDSFSEMWPRLAKTAGAELEIEESVGSLPFLLSACGVIVAAGGREQEGQAVLRELIAAGAPEAVVVGCESDYRLALTLVRAGAANYFSFPDDVGLCRSWMMERTERWHDRMSGRRFVEEERRHFDFDRLIGRSPALRAALHRASRVIPMQCSTVLIQGETGTGKELLARAIHYNSARAAGPFVEINCSAIPEQLLEAELFGHEVGAFTDARVAKPGLLEVADGGTLFLDEIGDMSEGLQAKVLRVVETREFRRLGGVRDLKVDLRIVAATHVDLTRAIREGKFREDLYYRLNVVPIELPALRHRGDDVVMIADHFIEKISREYELPRPMMTADIRRALLKHRWPGNVRELRNSIERAVLLGDGRMYVEDLFPPMARRIEEEGTLPFPAELSRIEEAAAKAMLEYCDGNKSEAAKRLGISRKHLYTLLGRGEGDDE